LAGAGVGVSLRRYIETARGTMGGLGEMGAERCYQLMGASEERNAPAVEGLRLLRWKESRPFQLKRLIICGERVLNKLKRRDAVYIIII